MKKPIAIKDFKQLEAYTKLIRDKLNKELWELVYKPMFKLARIEPVASNDDNPIKEALKGGVIYYENGGFKSSEKFSNRLTKALLSIGARYDRWENSFKIAIEDLPQEIWDTIKQSIQKAQKNLSQINQFLQYIEMNINSIIETMIFDDEVGTVLNDVQGKMHKNINVIEVELSPEDVENIHNTINHGFKISEEDIKKNFNESIQHYTKDFLTKRVPEIRRKVQQAILDGYREIDVQKMLETEYGIMERKAKFLAQNETSIMLAQIKKVHYSAVGFDSFMWHTILDARERPLHRQLNGKIFRFDEPPVIDEKTGQRGLPGETYNCRCDLTPIMSDSAFYNTNKSAAQQDTEQYKKVMQNV